jgi:hypothetical protein
LDRGDFLISGCMKRSSAAFLIGLAVLLGLTYAGWQLASPSTMKLIASKPPVATVQTPPVAKPESQEQTPPFAASEVPPYGPATAPEEMKPLPSPAEAAAYLKQPVSEQNPPAKPAAKQ